jgi:hypothetical protein
MKLLKYAMLGLWLAVAAPVAAQVKIDGFLQGLYGGRTDSHNPTRTEYTASETRLQLRTEHYAERSEFFARLDFTYDGAISDELDWELREGYLKFRLGNNIDFKIGRQILTWGTGDLIFINDVFAKDYRSFFVGRDDQYLKAPQNALRVEYYNPLGSFSLVWTPRFTPNRLPTGERLSYFNGQSIVGTAAGRDFYFDPPQPESRFVNSEIAGRFSRSVSGFNLSLYGYHGFYKNPRGVKVVEGGMMVPFYPRLNVFGASARGQIAGGILWVEGGFFDSQDNRHGADSLLPNSSLTAMIGFERQVASDLTANIQYQADYMLDYGNFERAQQSLPSPFIRDEVKHLLTSRVTQKLMDENLTLSGFVFWSPGDEDVYFRPSIEYKYTDEVTLAAGGNVFAGRHPNTDFGQFQKNDNAYLKVTYGFD